MIKRKLKLKDVSSFQDFYNQMQNKEILLSGGEIQPDFCLNYDHSYFFTFAEGYNERRLNEDIQNNSDLFERKDTDKFYYANDNMFSGDNSITGIRGQVLKFTK